MSDKSGKFAIIYQWSLILFGLLFPILVISTLNAKIYLAIRSRVKYRIEKSTSSCGDSAAVTSATDASCSHIDKVPTTGEVDSIAMAQKSKRKPLSKKDRSLVNILLVVTLSFVIFNSPQVIRGALFYLLHMKSSTMSPPQRSSHHFSWAFTNTLSTVNYAVNFFLYCLSSRKFRLDLASLFKE